MEAIKEALTFDDVLLLPRYSNVLPADTNISCELTNNIILKSPFLSSAMDTVTESSMAIAMAKSGGIGIVHRNLNIKKQTQEIIKVKKKNLLVGAAIGTSSDDLKRAILLITIKSAPLSINFRALSKSSLLVPLAAPTNNFFFFINFSFLRLFFYFLVSMCHSNSTFFSHRDCHS